MTTNIGTLVIKESPYEFQNAVQLLTDFFSEVDRVLSEIEQQ